MPAQCMQTQNKHDLQGCDCSCHTCLQPKHASLYICCTIVAHVLCCASMCCKVGRSGKLCQTSNTACHNACTPQICVSKPGHWRLGDMFCVLCTIDMIDVSQASKALTCVHAASVIVQLSAPANSHAGALLSKLEANLKTAQGPTVRLAMALSMKSIMPVSPITLCTSSLAILRDTHHPSHTCTPPPPSGMQVCLVSCSCSTLYPQHYILCAASHKGLVHLQQT